MTQKESREQEQSMIDAQKLASKVPDLILQRCRTSLEHKGARKELIARLPQMPERKTYQLSHSSTRLNLSYLLNTQPAPAKTHTLFTYLASTRQPASQCRTGQSKPLPKYERDLRTCRTPNSIAQHGAEQSSAEQSRAENDITASTIILSIHISIHPFTYL